MSYRGKAYPHIHANVDTGTHLGITHLLTVWAHSTPPPTLIQTVKAMADAATFPWAPISPSWGAQRSSAVSEGHCVHSIGVHVCVQVSLFISYLYAYRCLALPQDGSERRASVGLSSVSGRIPSYLQWQKPRVV